MNTRSAVRPAGRALRAIVVAGIALSIAGGSSALAHAQAAPATSAEVDTAHRCASQQPTLSRGSTGDCVYIVQKALYNFGFRGTPLDGEFGPVTEQIVREYQASRGIEVDGKVGPDTWSEIIDTAYGR